ncbi:Snare-complex protein syntaxin-18 N-terminus-domain-containing protein [Coniochaeta hoffmannii]|uniref:Snare-complex protein syntaxin-18 N-terminus-domain-containing protein n=1 Tax=Coniochaeta hoffmannii TaxID=91930 RepID=A0AA38RK18_9PEZI|nr:Snare-complex protein syntaxin-18 N-terminus-domain-containing protein [Coniochaeta hoffmannii]
MTDLTPAFNELLKEREAPPTRRSYNFDNINEFLKEAYRISTLITRLHSDLLSIRQAYLSTALPRKTLHLRTRSSHTPHHHDHHQPPQYLTDRDREEIDANAKSTLRDLNASIRALSDAEQLRRETASALLKKKYASRFGVSWASGGGALAAAKSPAQVAEEDAASQTAAHREAVLWFLRQRLGEVGRTQAGMMETRLTREMEKNRSVLAKARGGMVGLNEYPSMGGDVAASAATARRQSVKGLPPGEEERQGSAGGQYDLTEEQRQMFEKGNQDMLKHYESTLDKVRTAEKSLVEISELQTLLVNNLTTQSAHIDQLVADSFNTAENVGGGNQQLKKATQRASPARYTFFAASGLCAFLIIWDLLI